MHSLASIGAVLSRSLHDMPGCAEISDDLPNLPPFGPMSLAKKAKKKKRCGECEGCKIEEDCNECKYCLDKPKLGGSNTLRRQCIKRICTNTEAGEGEEVSAFTQECLNQALAHGQAAAAKEGGMVEMGAPPSKAAAGTRETPSIDGLPPHPPPSGKRNYTKSAPGRPTHTAYQKAVMARFYEFNKMPDTQERDALGKALGMAPRAVQVWFQNRRQREKEAKEAQTLRQGGSSAGGGNNAAKNSSSHSSTTTWHQMLPMNEMMQMQQQQQQQPPPPHQSMSFNPADLSQAFNPDLSQAALPDLSMGGMDFAGANGFNQEMGLGQGLGGFAPAAASFNSQPAGLSSGSNGSPTESMMNALAGLGAPTPSVQTEANPVDTGYGSVLLDAYANLPAASRAALPQHALKLVINAYMGMPLAMRANLQPHVIEFVEAAMHRTETRPPMGARDMLLRQAYQQQELQAQNDAILAHEMRAQQELKAAQELRQRMAAAPPPGEEAYAYAMPATLPTAEDAEALFGGATDGQFAAPTENRMASRERLSSSTTSLGSTSLAATEENGSDNSFAMEP